MCVICDNEYEGLQQLNIENCNNLINIPIINGLDILTIKNCPNLTTLPIIEGLDVLHLDNCPNITNIPIIATLERLFIRNCPNITLIPNIERLLVVSIEHCQNITLIPNIEGLACIYIINCQNIINITNISIFNVLIHLYIQDCNKINDYCSVETEINMSPVKTSKYTLKQFTNVNTIKRWYKRVKLSKKLWMYAELVIIDSMNPHKDNNQYLEQYIKEKVYD